MTGISHADRAWSDVLTDLELGIPVDRIAADQGVTIRSLTRRAYRRGRPDLAVQWDAVAKVIEGKRTFHKPTTRAGRRAAA